MQTAAGSGRHPIYSANCLQLVSTFLQSLLSVVASTFCFRHSGISIRSVAYHLGAILPGKKINKFFVIRCLNQIQICQVLRSIQSATDHLCKKHSHIVGNHTLFRRIQICDLLWFFQADTPSASRAVSTRKSLYKNSKRFFSGNAAVSLWIGIPQVTIACNSSLFVNSNSIIVYLLIRCHDWQIPSPVTWYRSYLQLKSFLFSLHSTKKSISL